MGELLKRQGIENYIVINDKHAYNVVRLDGRYCVIDLVDDCHALEYIGEFGKLRWEGKTLDDFMSIERHRIGFVPFPDKKNPELSMVDEKKYRSMVESLLVRQYDKMCHRLSYGDGVVHVAQIGSIDIGGRTYYQYLCQVSDDDGEVPVLVHCRNNLCEIMNTKRTGDLNPVLEGMVKSRFEPSNVMESLQLHRSDLGTVYRTSGTDDYHVNRVWKETSQIDSRFLTFKRRDGTVLAAVPTKNIVVSVGDEDVLLHRYRIFVRTRKGDRMTYRGYSVSSETDLFRMTGEREARCIANDLLGDESLLSAVRDRCGYVGMVLRYDDVCVVAMNAKVSEFMSSDAPETEQFTW